MLIMGATLWQSRYLVLEWFETHCACQILSLFFTLSHKDRCNRYHNALMSQPASTLIPATIATPLAVALFVIGQTLVISSTIALGITGALFYWHLYMNSLSTYYILGTFLGDYFGILMDHRVEGFPFNLLSDPMYDGSTMCFAATALWLVDAIWSLCYFYWTMT